MISYYFRTIKDAQVQQMDTLRVGSWVHVERPTDGDRAELESALGLDPSILKDAQDFFEVPRFERSSGGNYFFVRYPCGEAADDATAPLLLVVGESFVATIAEREVPFLKPFFEDKTDRYTTQKTKFFLSIMSALVAAYERELVRIRRAVSKDRVRLEHIKPHDIEHMVQYEQTLNDIISALLPTTSWLEQVFSGNYLQLYTEDQRLYEDLIIAHKQATDSAKSILKTIQNIRSAYEVLVSNALNTTIRRMTALTIILTVPTIIASLFGMNVFVPFGEYAHGFWVVLVLIAAVAGAVWYAFARNKWI